MTPDPARFSRSLRARAVACAFALLATSPALAIDWAEAARPYIGTTINVVMQSHPITEITREMLDEFTALTGIRVEREELARNALLQKQEIELASRTGAYDVMYIHPQVVHRYAGADWAVPLNEFLRDSTLTDADFNYEDFLQSTRDGFTVDGDIFGMPFNAESTALYYRTDIFDEHGLQPPTTWEELREVASQLHTPEVPAFLTRGAKGPNIYTFAGFLWSFGGQWVTEDNSPALDSDEAVRALEEYAGLLRAYGPAGAANYTHFDVYTDFMLGRAAMAFDATVWGPAFFANPEQSEVIGNWDVTMVPAGPAGRFPAYATHGLMIPQDSDSKEAAWLFIQWFTSRDTQLEIALQGAADQPRLSVYEDPAYQEQYGDLGNWLEVHLESIRESDPAYRATFLPQWPQVNDVVSTVVQEAVAGNSDYAGLLQEANSRLRRILR